MADRRKADGKGSGDAEEEEGTGKAEDRLLQDEGASSKECDEGPATSCVASLTRGLWVALGTLRKEGPCAQAVAPSSGVMMMRKRRRRRRFNLLSLLLGSPFLLQAPPLRTITSSVT